MGDYNLNFEKKFIITFYCKYNKRFLSMEPSNFDSKIFTN